MAVKFQTGIEHIIVLMLENRSFDHMCGWLGRGDGLQPTMFNRLNPANPASPQVFVTRDAEWLGDLTVDPSHAVLDVNVQLFGRTIEPSPPVATNVGFVLDYANQPGNTPANVGNVMKAFDASKLPVLSTLASEFVLCDRWFASVPGQTWPNRFFVHAATSGGFVDNNVRNYTFRTIYDNLEEQGYAWAIYFHDFPQSLTLSSLRKPEYLGHFRDSHQFFVDLSAGNLPAYSFIEPRYFDFLRWKANDQHPPHDVRLGEHLIADVYESLRRSPLWDSSLLFVLHDEHGGIFDHVPPPETVNPDSLVSLTPPFDFTRLGVRVPSVIVSPRVGKGVVDSTVYDHTSILATVRELFNLPQSLTERDRQANTVSRNLKPQTRTDTPTTVPRPPEATADMFHADSATAKMTAAHVVQDLAHGEASTAPLSEFQGSLVAAANALQTEQPPRAGVLTLARLVDNQHEGALHVRETATRVLRRE
jgi:phospholipase C